MNIEQIVENLIKINMDLQIKTIMHICFENPDHYLCSAVIENNEKNWFKYFSNYDKKNLFSKGKERLQSWIGLLQDPPVLYFNNKSVIPFTTEEKRMVSNITNNLENMRKEQFYFVMSALIIIFQIFGDGNHRTAKKFYENMTNLEITTEQENNIDALLNQFDYYTISRDPIFIMYEIVNKLIETNGGKRTNKKRTNKKRTNKKRTNKKRTNKKRTNKKIIYI